MSIGTTIKRLRQERDITQEQLAEYLGITSRSVSQWECDRTSPDISQLPALANIFEVSADVLLGIDITQKEKRIADIVDSAKQKWELGYSAEASDILRAGLREFPNSYKIMMDLMLCIWNESLETTNAEHKEEMTREAISLGEQILAKCTDDELRHFAIQLLCYTYPSIGETEKAVALAKKMPLRHLSYDDLLGNIYSGTERFETIRDNLFLTVSTNLWHEMCFNNQCLEDGSTPFTNAEYIIIYQKYLAILDIIFEDKNYGFCTQIVAKTHIALAKYYMKENRHDMAIASLQAAQTYSILQDTEYAPEKEYTCLLFRGKKYGGVSHNSPENDSLHQLHKMEDPIFDAIRNTPEFSAIEAALKPYAKLR